MAATRSKATTDHETIRRWVESKGGWPAHVKGTGRGGDPGILGIDFPGYRGQGKLEKLSWDDWFKWFDRKKLAFVHQPTTRFSKLVSRDTVTLAGRTLATKGRASGAKRATMGGTKKTTAKKTTAKKTTARTGTTGRTKRAAAKRPTAKRTPSATKRSTVKRSSSRRARAAR